MTCTGKTILVVDGDRAARGFVLRNLVADGYDVLEAGSVVSAQQLLTSSFVDLAVVDRALPDGDGLELLSFVRDAGQVGARLDVDMPLVMTSEHASALDRVRGLERGCDDYLSRPYAYAELRARISALLRRRTRMAAGARLRIGPLEVNALARQAWIDGRPVPLSSKEFSLLQTLAREPMRVFGREELMTTVWGWGGSAAAGYRTRTLDSHASRLRRKLAAHGANYVINVWGVGYRLVDVTAPEPTLAAAGPR
jgi:DNA-binding response OmpR family regulator